MMSSSTHIIVSFPTHAFLPYVCLTVWMDGSYLFITHILHDNNDGGDDDDA